MSIHVFALLCVLPLSTPVSGEGCVWDNEIRTNGFSGRAISPPGFPDIRVADDFVVREDECRISDIQLATIEDAAWWDDGLITVTIYADTGGEGPGAELVRVEREYTRLDTGGEYFGRSCYEYWIEDVGIDLKMGDYWLAIRNEGGAGSGTNYWMTSDGGVDGRETDTGWFSLNAGETWMPEGDRWHHAFETNMNSRIGACCLGNGECVDDVFEPDCDDRFALDSRCADLGPDWCTGACCHPDGTCDDGVSRNRCGDRFGQGVACDDLEEPCVPICPVVPAKKLRSVDSGERSHFGASVAMVGRTMVVGMARDPSGTGVKAAHVYQLRGAEPTWRGRVRPRSQTEFDGFGKAVALWGKPARLIAVAAPYDGVDPHHVGAVYVFRNGERDWEWNEEAVLRADDGEEDDYFGSSVAISADVVVVGVRSDDYRGYRTGSAYVFRFDGVDWRQEQKILAPNAREGNSFGVSVAIRDDLILIGATGADGGAAGSGAVFTFRYQRGQWTHEDTVVAPDAAPGDTFGTLAISRDVLLIGADGDDENGSRSGSAYIFREGETGWQAEQKILPDDGIEEARFGSAVAIDGDAAVVGAWNDSHYRNHWGRAYVFRRIADGTWPETAQLIPTVNPNGSHFGEGVAIQSGVVLVGAPNDSVRFDSSGSAYVFRAVSTDCNDNGIADACDIAQRRSRDRDENGLPDECEGVCCVEDTCVETIFEECEGFGCQRDPAWVCDGDVDGNGRVNPVDAGLVQAAFGSTREQDLCNYDIDCDGQINPVDAATVQLLFDVCNAPRSTCDGVQWTRGVDCAHFSCP